MGTPIIVKYPLDLTGNNPNNLVTNEVQELPVGTNRAIVPNYGAFYAQSLVVRDTATGQTLIPHTQYKAVQLYQEATVASGLEVTAVIVITDPAVGNEVSYDYQAIGGEFSYNVFSLRQMVEALDLDNRPVVWGEIIGTPDRFPPAPHLHDAGDLYGFEYIVQALDAVRYAIMMGTDATFEELRQMMIALDNELRPLILPVATEQEAIDGVRDDVLITPAKMRAAFDVWIQDWSFNRHINGDNPHQTDSSDIGLGDVTDAGFVTIGDVLANIEAPEMPMPS